MKIEKIPFSFDVNKTDVVYTPGNSILLLSYLCFCYNNFCAERERIYLQIIDRVLLEETDNIDLGRLFTYFLNLTKNNDIPFLMEKCIENVPEYKQEQLFIYILEGTYTTFHDLTSHEIAALKHVTLAFKPSAEKLESLQNHIIKKISNH